MVNGKIWIFALLCLTLFCPPAPTVVTKGIVIEVDAGAYDRQNTVVFFELPETLRTQKAFKLTQLDSKQPVAVQVEAGPTPRIVWIIRDALAAGQVRRYRLTPVSLREAGRRED